MKPFFLTFYDNLTHSTHQKKAVLNYESNANNGIIVLVVKKKLA